MKNVCSHNYIISLSYKSYDCHNSRLDQRGELAPRWITTLSHSNSLTRTVKDCCSSWTLVICIRLNWAGGQCRTTSRNSSYLCSTFLTFRWVVSNLFSQSYHYSSVSTPSSPTPMFIWDFQQILQLLLQLFKLFTPHFKLIWHLFKDVLFTYFNYFNTFIYLFSYLPNTVTHLGFILSIWTISDYISQLYISLILAICLNF